uniref:Gag-pol polyprotein n=1 Tax=Solanum tuberosum TaxID=4113 RepID=M1BIF0_SOLTU
MVADMRSRMSLFLVGLPHLLDKESKAAMLINDMGIARLMIHVQQVEEDKLRDREKLKNKRVRTSRNESGQQKSNVNWSYFQHKQKGPTPSFVGAHAPRNKFYAFPKKVRVLREEEKRGEEARFVKIVQV